VLVLAFRWVDNPSMIGLILKLAAYTYGPLLGLFLFAMSAPRHERQLRSRWTLAVALSAPVICWLIDVNQRALFGRYEVGLELLLFNAAITFGGLWLVSRRVDRPVTAH
jgi:energy-converting hydrogenase Eha subunit A